MNNNMICRLIFHYDSVRCELNCDNLYQGLQYTIVDRRFSHSLRECVVRTNICRRVQLELAAAVEQSSQLAAGTPGVKCLFRIANEIFSTER